MFLKRKLKSKVIRALGGRVKDNRLYRQDLVKRYWIDNSDDEADDKLRRSSHPDFQFDQTATTFQGERPGLNVDLRRSFLDEFFPVTICSKKQFLQVPDPSSVFVYDIVEKDPEFVILNDRSQVEVKYQPQ